MMFISIILLFMKDWNLVEIEITHLAICYHELGALKEDKMCSFRKLGQQLGTVNSWYNIKLEK